MPRMTTDDLCKVLHYAISREMRVHGVVSKELEHSAEWHEAPEDYRMALRGAVTSIELVTRQDERDAFRAELTDCMDDLQRNAR